MCSVCGGLLQTLSMAGRLLGVYTAMTASGKKHSWTSCPALKPTCAAAQTMSDLQVSTQSDDVIFREAL